MAVHIAVAAELKHTHVKPFYSGTHNTSPVFSDVFLRRSGTLVLVAQRYNDISFNLHDLRFSISSTSAQEPALDGIAGKGTDKDFKPSIQIMESVTSESCIVAYIEHKALTAFTQSLPPGQATISLGVAYRNDPTRHMYVDVVTGSGDKGYRPAGDYSYLTLFALVDPATPYDQLEAWALYHAGIGVDRFELYFQKSLADSPALRRRRGGHAVGVSAQDSFTTLARTVGGAGTHTSNNNKVNVTVAVAEWLLPFWGTPKRGKKHNPSIPTPIPTSKRTGAKKMLSCARGFDAECYHTAQPMAQNSVLHRRRGRSKWIAYVDTDEFMVVNPAFPSLDRQLRSYRHRAISHAVLWNSYFVLVPRGEVCSHSRLAPNPTLNPNPGPDPGPDPNPNLPPYPNPDPNPDLDRYTRLKEPVQYRNGSSNIVRDLTLETMRSSDVIREGDINRFKNRPKIIANTDNALVVGVHNVHISRGDAGTQGTRSFLLHLARPERIGGIEAIRARVRTSFATLLTLPRRDLQHLTGGFKKKDSKAHRVGTAEAAEEADSNAQPAPVPRKPRNIGITHANSRREGIPSSAPPFKDAAVSASSSVPAVAVTQAGDGADDKAQSLWRLLSRGIFGVGLLCVLVYIYHKGIACAKKNKSNKLGKTASAEATVFVKEKRRDCKGASRS